MEQLNNNTKKDKEDNDKINTNIKIPKMNPLSNMGKGFNNQKSTSSKLVDRSHPSTVEENIKEEDKI